MGLLDDRAALAGTVAAVAGGGGGLGAAVTTDLAAAGVRVAVCDVDADALAATGRRVRDAGGTVAEVLGDVRDPATVAALLDGAAGLGPLRSLVNVVGGTFRAPFGELRPNGRDALIRTNFTWVADAIGQAAPRLADAGGGSIVTLTSIEAHRAAPGYAVYAAMKAAVEHLTRTLAVELAPAGIRVNCVAPDFVPTAGLGRVAAGAGSGGALAAAAGTDDDAGDRLTIPLGHKGRPEDVANCVLFLVSDLAAYVTGTTLHPDGGALAGSGWMRWPDEGFTARPPAWVLDQLESGPRAGPGGPSGR